MQLDSACPTCGARQKRSDAQNNRYWKLLRLMEVKGYKAEVWHEYLASRFLPMREIDMPDWSIKLVRISTSDLAMHKDPKDPNKPNWDDYMGEVEAFCAEQGVWLEDEAA